MKINKKPLILISNDDGFEAKGIKELTKIAQKFGNVVVVAPKYPQSAMGCAITIRNTLSFSEIHSEENLQIYHTTGTPIDCVKIALTQILQSKPDLILSGINHGINTAVNVIYSGTMGVVLEGCVHNIPSIGFSLDSHEPDIDFSNITEITSSIIQKTLETPLPAGVGLNVNFPNIPASKIKGTKICHQTAGYWWDKFDITEETKNEKKYLLKGEFINLEENNEHSDVWAIQNNYVAIVPVKCDFTDYSAIEKLKF